MLIQIDIGFADTVTPGPVEMEYPTLLEPPGPRLLAYPRETVISEKLEAMVKLGIANSRMKDFHDLHSLATNFEFDGKALTEAVRATFKRRRTELPAGGVPLAFKPEFYEDENKIKQWNAFCNKNKSYVQEAKRGAGCHPWAGVHALSRWNYDRIDVALPPTSASRNHIC
jgi:hypothetical protein